MADFNVTGDPKSRVDTHYTPTFKSWSDTENQAYVGYKPSKLNQRIVVTFPTSSGNCSSYRGPNLLKARQKIPVSNRFPRYWDFGHSFRLAKTDRAYQPIDVPFSAATYASCQSVVFPNLNFADLGYTVNGFDVHSGPSGENFHHISGAPTPRSSLDLISLGPAAIARANPSKPQFDLLYALAELWRDPPISRESLSFAAGIGSNTIPRQKNAITTLKRGAKRGSDAYLWAQFAAIPTVGDGVKLFNTIRRSHDLIDEYEKRAGILQRKRFRIEHLDHNSGETVQSSAGNGYWLNGSSTADGFWQNGVYSFQSYTSRDTWFSGAFDYYIAELSGLKRKLAEYEHLYGSPSLATAWNLMPWSWFLDWFGNYGSVIRNLSYLGQDSSVMRWGYIMSEWTRVTSVKYSLSVPTGYSNFQYSTVKAVSTGQVSTSLKQRVRAYPYVFSASLPDFSASQIAIMGALGVSRVADA